MTFPCEFPRPGRAADFALHLQGQLPLLVTERLVLRAPKVEDFDAFTRIACTRRGRFLGGPMTREQAWDDFARLTSTWLLHGHGAWTIGHAGDTAGFVLLGFEPGDRAPELGVLLLAEAEGQGIAYEAAQAARAHAFDTLGWDDLVSYIASGNDRAIALARRLGAHEDGAITEAGDTALVYRHVAGGHA